MEVTFARFRLLNGVGTGVIYSHPAYGKKAKDEITAWLKSNGKTAEQNLLKWDAMPNIPPPK